MFDLHLCSYLKVKLGPASRVLTKATEIKTRTDAFSGQLDVPTYPLKSTVVQFPGNNRK